MRPSSTRLVIADFPTPGWACTHMPGLEVSFPTQPGGSTQTNSAVSRSRPIAIPVAGKPAACTNGNSPATWVVDARYSDPGTTAGDRPDAGPRHPRTGATGPLNSPRRAVTRAEPDDGSVCSERRVIGGP